MPDVFGKLSSPSASSFLRTAVATRMRSSQVPLPGSRSNSTQSGLLQRRRVAGPHVQRQRRLVGQPQERVLRLRVHVVDRPVQVLHAQGGHPVGLAGQLVLEEARAPGCPRATAARRWAGPPARAAAGAPPRGSTRTRPPWCTRSSGTAPDRRWSAAPGPSAVGAPRAPVASRERAASAVGPGGARGPRAGASGRALRGRCARRGAGRSRMTSSGFLSVRRPWNTGCRSRPSLVHSVKWTWATYLGFTHTAPARSGRVHRHGLVHARSAPAALAAARASSCRSPCPPCPRRW